MRILLADSDSISRTLITRFLNVWGHQVLSVADGDETWQILQQDYAPKMVVLDSAIRGIDAAEICRRLRASKEGPYRYVLLITRANGREDVLRSLETGADDFVTKPVDAAALKARLNTGRRILELQDRLVQALEATRFEASHDSLTGLWNRAAMLEFLHGQFVRAGRDGISLALVIADLDYFKQVNDSYGHLAGDEILRQVAKRLRKPVRPYDWVGRYGGEEFLIIAPDCTLANAHSMCERLREAVASKPFEVAGNKVRLTMSFGATTTAESGALDEEGLIRAADAALYLAKENGRNRTEMSRRAIKSRTPSLRPSAAEKRKELIQ